MLGLGQQLQPAQCTLPSAAQALAPASPHRCRRIQPQPRRGIRACGCVNTKLSGAQMTSGWIQWELDRKSRPTAEVVADA